MRRIEVGDKVLCVDARPHTEGEGATGLKVGETYTIARLMGCDRCGTFVDLAEVLHEEDYYCGRCMRNDPCDWFASRFIKPDPNVEKEVREEKVTA